MVVLYESTAAKAASMVPMFIIIVETIVLILLLWLRKL